MRMLNCGKQELSQMSNGAPPAGVLVCRAADGPPALSAVVLLWRDRSASARKGVRVTAGLGKNGKHRWGAATEGPVAVLKG